MGDSFVVMIVLDHVLGLSGSACDDVYSVTCDGLYP